MPNTLISKNLTCKKGLYLAILISFIASCLIFIPFIILDHGIFIFFGDFNAQQIPFYQLAHKAVRSGNIFWNWNTDLGANFIGSYSYYMLMSPFFWLTLPFPTSFVPYLMGPLLILKHTCAAIFSYLYLKRFVKNYQYAILGSLLYAFSSFIVYNIFFNQFHESIVFFPLLLICMEEYLLNNKKMLFCISIIINCLVNYWMFIGECVFLIIYFLWRITDPKCKITLKKFLGLLIEAIIGITISSFILYPSLLAISNNTRVGEGHLITGWNMLLYNSSQRIPAIIQSLFFPPELPSKPNFFPIHKANWASMAAWLPFVSLTGVISFIYTRRKNWIKGLLITCFIMSLVPFLNSIFVLFNNGYYCRWFYMPILLMCLATIMAFENTKSNLKIGLKWTSIISAILLLPGILKLVPYPHRFFSDMMVVTISIIGMFFIIFKYRKNPFFPSILIICVSIISVTYSCIFIINGKKLFNDADFMRTHIINSENKINLPEDEFYRIDIYKDLDNIGMFWNIPTIQAFHSIVPSSIQNFYGQVWMPRTVSSRVDIDMYELRSLLSSKYLFVRKDKKSEKDVYELMPALSIIDSQNNYDIYENCNFIPMGFCYDYCIGDFAFSGLTKEQKRKVLLRTMYLEENDIQKYQNILPEMIEIIHDTLNYDNFEQDVLDRQSITAKNFTIDKTGFSAQIDLPKDNLVFFSVPHDTGWTATVNNKPVKIVKANIGFMAVKCDKGHNDIRFDYYTPGLSKGFTISIIGLVALIIYGAFCKILYSKSYHNID